MAADYSRATFRYATASEADLNAISTLVHSAYRGTAGWTTEHEYLGGGRITHEQMREDLARPRSRILLLEMPPDAANAAATPTLLACAHVADEDGGGYFGMFSVSPDLQGGGIGKRMIAEGERIVKEEFGLATMVMTVIDIRHTLIAFYERRGYKNTGKYKPFPYGDERFGIPKRDDLRFVILEKQLL